MTTMIHHYASPIPRSYKYICSGPLRPHIESFLAICVEDGYSRRTVRERRILAVRLSRWLVSRGLSLKEFNERQLEQFQAKYPDCGRDGNLLTGRQLLAYLRSISAVPPAPVDHSPIAELMRRYESFLLSERALAPVTVSDHLRIVRSFLTWRFGKKPLRLQELQPRDLHRFILEEARRVSRGRAQQAAGSLRPLMRFLCQRGLIESDLVAAIPRVATWRLSHLPKFLPPEQIEQVLQSCDRRSAVGRRDYAMLLFMARLGLRSAEIAGMTLEDFDWERSEFIVHGKGPRDERLPLPRDVGTALLRYLRHGRPVCSSRHVFVRMRTPFRAFADPNTVYPIVRSALERAGLNPPSKGGHLFRHSLATDLLSRGASLTEIGQLLRHRQQTTTQIYAKVDLKALHALAQPWMGEKR
jgi:site-specific recombinase XerD